MSKLRFMLIGRLLSVLAITLFILPVHVTTAFAEEKAPTKIRHKPVEYYVPTNRVQVEAKVEDKTGIALVRCYFRAAGQADYVFVPMPETEKGIYQGILPAPAGQTAFMEYLFLVVTGQNRVIKSQIFSVDKKEKKDAPSWQMAGKEGPLPVSTEISQAADITGYYADNIALNFVDPSLRYGYAVALYDVSKMVLAGNAAGSAASASSGGAVIAEAGGLSTGLYIGLGVGALAIIGGAAAAGGGGGGGGSSSSTPTPTPASRFVNNGNGTVTDTQTGHMWADRDNGSDINWPNARSYCEGYNRGGVSGWRMPTIYELQDLYRAGAFGSAIGKSGGMVWASETSVAGGSIAAFVPVNSGGTGWRYQSDVSDLRALPVRSGK